MTLQGRRCAGVLWGAAICVVGVTALAGSLPPDGRVVARPGVDVRAQLRREMTTKRRYSLAARVRPLLFWIGRDNVGEARLGWLAAQNGERGYEMLIGSDPKKAPRRINRWGYITEIEERAGVQVFGLMTEADEQSLEDAKARSGTVTEGSRVFKIIRATIATGTATSAVQGVALSDRLTLHDLDSVIAQLPATKSTRSVQVPAGADPGFLFAMAALLRDNIARAQRTGKAPTGTKRAYIYANKVYEVVTKASEIMKQATIKGRRFENVIESEFEARARAAPKGASYRILYGTQGALREVPIRIVYRPNWWFEAECVLVDNAGS